MLITLLKQNKDQVLKIDDYHVIISPEILTTWGARVYNYPALLFIE